MANFLSIISFHYRPFIQPLLLSEPPPITYTTSTIRIQLQLFKEKSCNVAESSSVNSDTFNFYQDH